MLTYEIASTAVQGDTVVMARDLVALAAYRAAFSHEFIEKMAGNNFGTVFSAETLRSVQQFLPDIAHPLTIMHHLLSEGSTPVHEWRDRAIEILGDPAIQASIVLPRLRDALTKSRGDRLMGFSYYFEPETMQVTIKGKRAFDLWKAFRPPVKQSVEAFDARQPRTTAG